MRFYFGSCRSNITHYFGCKIGKLYYVRNRINIPDACFCAELIQSEMKNSCLSSVLNMRGLSRACLCVILISFHNGGRIHVNLYSLIYVKLISFSATDTYVMNIKANILCKIQLKYDFNTR